MAIKFKIIIFTRLKTIGIMKIKFILLLAVVFFTGTAFSQTGTKIKPEKVRFEKPREYVVKTDELKTCFKSGTIPADFPKYNTGISEEENKEIAAQWAKKPENYALLSQEGIDLLNKYMDEKNKKE